MALASTTSARRSTTCVTGRSVAAMIAIENSIEGGVSATQDALANIPGLRIIGEYLVPVNFVLVARPGTTLADVRVDQRASGRLRADATCGSTRPCPTTATSRRRRTSRPRATLLENDDRGCRGRPARHHRRTTTLEVLAEDIGDNPNAVTRFVLVAATDRHPGRAPAPTRRASSSSCPIDRAGRLVEMLEQFATRGVNMSLLESRPIGDALGRYRFVIDLDGHILDERVADALLGLKRFSPNVHLPRLLPARRQAGHRGRHPRYDDEVFIEARDWLRGIVTGAPVD